ncbi:hypothetical protein [Streptomyces brasiliensis]|uniref:Metallo-beta-lactamase domain-containing protein n=1 Tax=Streptomyces brasiliensis TaxID=1954 RepID=A0A917LA54_9ACTN|nr:hypothetical protein [Streptomyces brasiliensis]GGJ53124.1 hypothetical protein GCM10010121_074920 [Streptomyces brasiliensis]
MTSNPSLNSGHSDGACDECLPSVPATLSRRNILAAASAFAAASALAATSLAVGATPASAASAMPKLEWYSLVPGFVGVATDEYGRPKGTGFVTDNPWGAYTAYLITTNGRGQRTWRIENMLQLAPHPDGGIYSQGSTMWLFEGDGRALLVDTAQNTPETIGTNDLKTVCRYLLGHENDGSTRLGAVDFDVAITHLHGDHTGKVSQMTDRTVYYPDLDWRPNATANWVPVRQDGGATANGSTGRTVNRIELGNRRIDVVAMYGHTAGSTGYLDAQNLLMATGDAIGSAYVWAQSASATTEPYAAMLDGLRKELQSLKDLTLLPAHFYQVRQFSRADAPIKGRVPDLSYLDDMSRAAHGALDGSILADPYHELGREEVWISGGTARMVYSLTNLYPGGPTGGQGDPHTFHGVNIPSHYPQDPYLDTPYAFLNNIKTGLVLIRDSANETSFLMRGSQRALLITSGRSKPGVAEYAAGIAGPGAKLDVLITDGDPAGLAGLSQFDGYDLFAPKGVSVPSRRGSITYLVDGDTIDLGKDSGGRRVKLQVDVLPGRRPEAITVLDPVSRALFTGESLGTQGTDGLTLGTTVAAFTKALATWRTCTDGHYDTIYTAHNYQWVTRPAYVDSLQAAADADPVATSPVPGYKARTSGTGELLAWLFTTA